MSIRTKPVLLLAALLCAALAPGLTGCKKAPQGESAQAKTNTPAPGQTTGQAPGQAPSGQPERTAKLAGLPSGMPPVAATPIDPAKLPAVVAKINGQEIKKAQLVEEAAQMRQQLAQTRGIQAPLNSDFYKQVLDGIIARTLLTQEAKAQNVTVTEAEVEQQMAQLRSQAPTPEDFKQKLKENGLTEATLRQRIRTEGAVQKFLQTKVLAGVTVSDQVAKDFYDKNQDKMKRPEQVHVRHILLRADASAPAADKQKAKAKAEDLLKRAQKGEDFAKLASENSDDPGSKIRGGELPWFTHGQMVPPFDKAAFALTKPNELSPVVESQFGYHVIQLVERQAAAVAPFDMVKGQIEEFLKQKQSQQVLAAHVQELRAKGKVETFI